MKATEAVKEVMERKEVKQAVLARRIGLDGNNNSTLRMRLRQDNITVTKLTELLQAMDYKIVVMPADTRMNAEWIEIE